MESLSRSPHVPSLSISMSGRDSPIIFSPNSEYEEWVGEWETVEAKGLIDIPFVAVDTETSVEDACDTLLSKDTSCIAIKDSSSPTSSIPPFLGLFDFADVNAFLTLAALQHTKSPEELRDNPRTEQIINAAKAGEVSVRLVSNLSEKNPLEELPDTATLVDLLRVFATGVHRVLIRSTSPNATFSSLAADSLPLPNNCYPGFISDRALLSYFYQHAQLSAPLSRFLNNPLHSLTLPSINLRAAVVSCTASARVLDAMSLMCQEGVSSIAVVIDDSPSATPGPGPVTPLGLGQMNLLSAVSVTDIGKIVVPAQSNQILQMPLQQFVSQIKEPDGSTDGEDRYPVYSVYASSTLRYTIEKVLATNAHRVFVTEDPHSNGSGGSSPVSVSPSATTASIPMHSSQYQNQRQQLRGVVSISDVLALFARLAGLPDVDTSRTSSQTRKHHRQHHHHHQQRQRQQQQQQQQQQQYHRRFSSASSGSGSGSSNTSFGAGVERVGGAGGGIAPVPLSAPVPVLIPSNTYANRGTDTDTDTDIR